MKAHIFLLFVLFISTVTEVRSQSERFLFGKVNAEDFTVREQPLDPNANVLILMSYGEVYINTNSELVYVVQHRIRILNENGLDAANQSFGFNPEFSRSRRQDVQAHTLNMEANGRIRRTAVGRNGVFIEEASKDLHIGKITFPDVRVGSILEFTYKIHYQGYFRFPTWYFQQGYPTLHSEFITYIPNSLTYMRVSNGFVTMERQEQFPYRNYDRIGIYLPPEGGTKTHFVSKNVPALYEEPYITTMSDYRAAIQFQLHGTNYYNAPNKVFLSTWPELTKELLKHRDFGVLIASSPELIREYINIGIPDTASALDKAKMIFAHVSKNFNHSDKGGYFPDIDTPKLMYHRTGNSASIAFALMNLLRYAGLEAHPVLISTRSHGRIAWEYPLVSQFDHVIIHLTIGSQTWLLDPISESVPFGLLSFQSLNKEGYLVKEPGVIRLPLNPRQKAREDVGATITLQNDGSASIDFEIRSSDHAGMLARTQLSKSTLEDFANRSLRFVPLIDSIRPEVIHGDDANQPLILKGTLVSKNMLEPLGDLVMLRPMIALRWDENPLKSVTRYYPVNFGIEMEQNVTVKIELPDGYKIESLPPTEQARVGQDAFFQSSFVVHGQTVHATYRFRIQRTEFNRVEYTNLRALFAQMASIHTQGIVLRRTD